MDIVKFAHILGKLAYDDEFRKRFVSDPEGTVASMGIDPRTANIPSSPIRLASKQTLQDEYEARLRRLTMDPNWPLHFVV